MSMGIAAAVVGGAALGAIMAPDAPDTSQAQAAAQANAATASRAQDLAEKQYADQQALLQEYSPLFKQQIQAATDAQAKSTAQSDAQWQSYQQNFAPIEQSLAQKSLNYDTPERREAEATAAAADVQKQYGLQMAAAQRQQASMGVNPNSGRAQALESQNALGLAAATAGAMNTARHSVEDKGMAYVDNAARFGRNMPSTGLQAASLAGTQGQQAQGAYAGLSSATAAGGQYAAPLMGTSISANNSAGSLFGQVAQTQLNADIAQSNSVIGGMGAGLKAYGMYKSSEKLKDMGDEVDGRAASDAVEASPARGWRYRPGLGDGDTKPRMGPTAESLRDATGGVVSDGRQVDGIAMLGLHHAAVGNHAQRLERIEERLGLSDAMPAHGARAASTKRLGLGDATPARDARPTNTRGD